ncbi:unnamed protein product [Caenorhabditis sp. 36 PRJEB53466]|nr:unnamed protein product [Caenorhabditis sp. 36 PRJEB53466]
MNSPSPEYFDYRSWPNTLAAFLMSINCFLGILLGGAILYIFIIDSQQRTTSFNLMCAIRAVNNIAVLTTGFLLVFIPGALLGFSLYPAWLESLLIGLSLNFYIFNEFQSIYISINRFIAVFFPTKYNKLCGIGATFLVHFFLYADRFQNTAFETYYRIQLQTFVSFSAEFLMFGGTEVSADGMVLKFAFMFGVALVANICTFGKITHFYLILGSRHDVDNWRRVRKNMNIFCQTVLQDALFFVDNFFTFQMSGLSDHRFWFFICCSFVWQTVHVVDGFVMIMFNDRLSLLRNALFPSEVLESSVAKQLPLRPTLPEVT